MDLPVVPPAVHRRPGGRSTVFAVLVAVALVTGAGVLAVVLLATGRPDAVVVGFVLAVLPVGPLVAWYLWLDRYEPEPRRLLVGSFGWGALVATGGVLALQTFQLLVADPPSLAVSAVLVAPITEEAGKGLFVLLLLWSRRHVIDGPLDGLVYAGLVGVGFAFTENALYYAGAYSGDAGLGPGGLGSAGTLFVFRGLFSPFAHPLFTSAIGLGVGVMVSTRSRALKVVGPLLGYLVAVLLHAAWNGSAFLEGGRFFVLTYFFAMVPGLLALIGLAVWFRFREGRRLAWALADLSRWGYVDPREVPWLVGLPARRTARRDAALRGGPRAEHVMREYQRQAVELAVLHHRVLRGTAPDDAQTKGALMAQRLAALRLHMHHPHLSGGVR